MRLGVAGLQVVKYGGEDAGGIPRQPGHGVGKLLIAAAAQARVPGIVLDVGRGNGVRGRDGVRTNPRLPYISDLLG